MKGFSPRNLKYMRAFAAAWPDRELVQRTVAQLSWGQNIVLLEELEHDENRLWYTARTLARLVARCAQLADPRPGTPTPGQGAAQLRRHLAAARIRHGGPGFQRSLRARLRNLLRITPRRYKYPPDMQEEAIRLVLEQAERLSEEWTRD